MKTPTPLVLDLIDAIGEEAVVWHDEDLLVYEYDGTIDRGNPDVIALPANTDDVVNLIKIANKYDAPVTPRGAGTGLSGGALAAKGGVIIGMNRMRRILDVDPENKTALVQPGVVNLDLGSEAERYGLAYAPDPSSQRACTIGGNIAENAGGPHTLAWGTTTNHVLALELVTADGEVQWIGHDTRDEPGYDLVGCVVGSEGTVGIVTQALVRLVPRPTAVRTMLAIYDSVRQASNAVSAVVASGIVPAALEMIDKMTIAAVEPVLNTGFPLDAEAVLLVEVDGPESQVEAEGARVEGILNRFEPREVRSATDPEEREHLWAGRKGAIGALGQIMPNYYLLDGVVPRTQLPDVLDGVYEIAERYRLPVANMFHAGDGNLHPCLLFDEREPGATERVLDAGGEIMRLCVDAGGAITGEHGVGLEKRDYLPWIFTEADMDTMKSLRAAFGPTENFNPCKIFPKGHGCGEAGHQHAQHQIAKFGPKAFV
ncbi:MAG: FAD-binding protein [Chloroflexi bacterium]|nr:FAD-binding protein [Chloroflexota bacterium]